MQTTQAGEDESPAVHCTAYAYEVKHGEMLHELTESDAASMGANGNAILRKGEREMCVA